MTTNLERLEFIGILLLPFMIDGLIKTLTRLIQSNPQPTPYELIILGIGIIWFVAVELAIWLDGGFEGGE